MARLLALAHLQDDKRPVVQHGCATAIGREVALHLSPHRPAGHRSVLLRSSGLDVIIRTTLWPPVRAANSTALAFWHMHPDLMPFTANVEGKSERRSYAAGAGHGKLGLTYGQRGHVSAYDTIKINWRARAGPRTWAARARLHLAGPGGAAPRQANRTHRRRQTARGRRSALRRHGHAAPAPFRRCAPV